MEESVKREQSYLIKVCLPIPVRGSFDYISDEPVPAGSRVMVPFGGRKSMAYCLGVAESAPRAKLKKIMKVIDETPLISPEMLTLSLWMEKRYFTPRGMALKVILPTELKGKARDFKLPAALPFTADLRKELPALPQSPCNVYVSGSVEFQKSFLRREMEKTISAAGRVIFLVPLMNEASSFEDILGGFRAARFGSDLLPSHRYRILCDFRGGKLDVIIGTRSAVFAPLGEKGLIIMTGAQKKTYIEEQHPRYSTEEVAMKRAELSSGRFIACGGALSVEQFYRVKKGGAAAVCEKNAAPPRRRVCDLLEESVNFGVSSELLKNIKSALNEKKQALLYSPRGGWATSYVCSACKFVMKCEKCGRKLCVSGFNLYCSSCKKTVPVPERCPRCRRKKMKNRGIGRGLMASFLRKQFPENRIAAVDADATASDKKRIYEKYEKGDLDVLISGPGFAAVRNWSKTGLFAVMDADFLLYGDDWAAEEKTFLWLSSLASSFASGRTDAIFMAQTKIAPDLVRAALSGDESFYEKQLDVRRKFAFPPFARILRIKISGRAASEAALKLRADIKDKVMELSPEDKPAASAIGVEIRVKIDPDADFEIEKIRGASVTIEEER